MKNALNDWNKLNFNWMEIFELIKAVIQPQFLFLFQELPIKMSPKVLKDWQSSLTKFLWANERLRRNF